MIDKVQKIREVIEKRYECWKEKEFNSHSIESEIRISECQHDVLKRFKEKKLKIYNMKQEDKELLLKDLSARLPYKVKCKYSGEIPIIGEVTNNIGVLSNIYVDKDCPFEINGGIYGFADVKPYLRSMSSMTEEEKAELFQLMGNGTDVQRIDFYISHHFDYRGLIEKNLALEASEGIYNLND